MPTTCADPNCADDCNCAAMLSRNHPPADGGGAGGGAGGFESLDWADDTPLACGIENPESCEACQ